MVMACAGPDRAIVALPLDAAAGSAQPHIARAPDGTMVLSWLEPDGDGVALRYATLGAKGWQRQGTVATGSDWFVNWADFPSLAAGPAVGGHEGAPVIRSQRGSTRMEPGPGCTSQAIP